MPFDPDSIWTRCMLDGEELDKAVALAEGWELQRPSLGPRGGWRKGQNTDMLLSYSTDWNLIGPIIFRDQIFLDPPHDVHVHGGPSAGWWRYNGWTATVSARIRTYPNPYDSKPPGCVGRGCGNDPMVAACRAYLASKGWKP